MKLPNQIHTIESILSSFRSYLTEQNLSPISRKLYLGDVRRFLLWQSSDSTLLDLSALLSSSTYLDYLDKLRTEVTASSMIMRSLASLKRFGSFLAITHATENPTQNLTLNPQIEISTSTTHFDKYIKHFTNYINSIHLSPLTIKSYKSDITRFLNWASDTLPSNSIVEVLTTKNIEKYLNYLSQLGSSTVATIDRKNKSLTRFKAWYLQSYPVATSTDSTLLNQVTKNHQIYRSIPFLSSLHHKSESQNPGILAKFVKKINSRKILPTIWPSFSIGTALSLAILLLFISALGIFGYRQLSRDKVILSQAYPGTPVTPNRQLSFQGRLENAGGTPITTATNFVFKLFDNSTGPTELYSSGTCSITPDSDGVFSTQIGSTCGSSISSSIFTENSNIWLEVTVGAETLSPRQQIATVAYALNSETIQGFPISATVSAIRNTVVPMNQWGEIIVGEQNPRLRGVSGTFQISAPSLSIVTSTGSNGNITLAPDGTGQVNLNGNTTSTNFFNVSNSQLTTGSLITGTVANNNTGYKLFNLLSGSSPTSKFSVDDAGNTVIGGTLTLPNSNTLTGVTNYTQFSGGISVGGATTYYLNSSGDLNANAGTFAGTLQANGTFDANGQVDLGDGGDAITINGSSLTFTGFDCTGYTNGGALTANGSGVISCSNDDGGGGGGSSNWRYNLGTLSPLNDTVDLLIGANATSSAKAGFININSGTPTATLSAGTTGGAFLTASGDLSTTARQSLTLGNSSTYDTTGNILLNPNGTGDVGIGFTNPLYTLDVNGNVGFGNQSQTDKKSFRFEEGVSSALTGLSGTSQLRIKDNNFAESVTGATYITHDGDGSTAIGNTRSTSSLSILRFFTTPNGGSPTERMTIDSEGNIGLGVTSPDAILDIKAATTAKAQLNLTTSAGVNPSAPVNGDTWWNGTNLNFYNGSTTTDLLAGAIGGLAWTDGGTYLYPTNGETLGNSVAGGSNKLTGLYLADSSPLSFGTDNDFIFSFNNSTSTLGSTLLSGTRLGIGTTSALATLDVRSSLGTIPTASISGNTAMSALVIDQSGIGDLFTASKSGDTKFVITNSGNVGIGVSNPTNKLEIGGATSTVSNTTGDITIDSASNSTSFAGDSLININNLTASGVITTTYTGNAGLVVGNGTAGFAKIGSATIGDNSTTYLGFDTDSNGTNDFQINDDGSVTFRNNVNSVSTTTEGTVFYDSDSAYGTSDVDHLYMMGSDSAWHRIALDMTKYSTSSAGIATGSYIEIAHNQNTNDLSLTGWFLDTISGTWKTISELFSKIFIHDLDNEFNPEFTQKDKVTTVSLKQQENSYGTGADGAVTFSSNFEMGINTIAAGRSCADGGEAVSYSVTALTSTTATLEQDAAPGCLNVGDEVLLINLRGTPTANDNVGNWETLRVSSEVSGVVTFTTAKTKYYGDGASDDTNIGVGTSAQTVMLQRVPNYTTVTVNTGVNVTPSAWKQPSGSPDTGSGNAGEGGVLFFRATGAVSINGTGTLNANGLGYQGGNGPTQTGTNRSGGNGGEAFCGIGGAGSSGTNGGNGAAGGAGGSTGSASANGGAGYCGGGGGANVTGLGGIGSSSKGGSGGGGSGPYGGGGGAGYGNGGNGGNGSTNGASGGTNSSGNGGGNAGDGGAGGGGGSYGDANLTKLMLGSGGGSGGAYTGNVSSKGGNGGNGGGIIYVAAGSVTVSGGIQANGGAGITPSCGSGAYNGAGGGGSGGSIKIVGNTLNLGSSLVTASLGAGGTTGCINGSASANDKGGNGGVGRIATFSTTSISGATSPTYTTDTSIGSFNSYKVITSKELSTSGAVSYGNIEWTENLPSGTEIELQTRSGNTANSTDGTWETWKPTTTSTTINDANTHTDWTGTNATVADGDVTRDINYYEDEDESTATSVTKFTTTSANGYAERTLAAVDLSARQYVTLWLRSSIAGNIITLGMGEAAATEQTKTITINDADTWQKVYWDISSITGTSRDAITKFRITSSQNTNTVYLDNILAQSYLTTATGSTITSTANNYIQYRAILTTTSALVTPTLSEVRINYNDGAAKVINDRLSNQNDTDTYNQATRLNITTVSLDDYKSLDVSKLSTGITSSGVVDPGTGADGDVTVTTSTNTNTTSLIAARSCADGGDEVNYSVTALTSRSATLVTSPSLGCLAVGDEILLINLQGSNTAFGNVGKYETLRVESQNQNVITFATAKTNYYGDGLSDDTNIGITYGSQRVMLQRVPNYNNFVINANVTLTPNSWDGTKGGVVFFRAKTASINGTISSNSSGYQGGNGPTQTGANRSGGNGGEAFCGIGGAGSSGTNGGNGAAGGAGGSTSAAPTNGGAGYCGGGGGANNGTTSIGGLGSSNSGGSGGGGSGPYGGGGGAGYGNGGNGGNGSTNGASGGTNSSGNGGGNAGDGGAGGGGGSYGDANLTKLMLGSGGGSGGAYTGNVSSKGGNGGNGGGIIYVAAGSVTVSGGIQANGGAGITPSCGSGAYNGGGGGGSGGSIKIVAQKVDLGPTLVTAALGDGGTTGCNSGSATANNKGGNGGVGRVAVNYSSSLSGSSSPSYAVAQVPTYSSSIFISNEIPTPNATTYNRVSWLADETPYGIVEVQTRSGASNNSTDGSWEEWKPATSSATVLDNANTHTNWISSNSTLTVADGDQTRNINYYEDEDEPVAGNTTKLSATSNATAYAEARIASTDLSAKDFITVWLYATTSGTTVKIGFGENNSAEHETLVNIDAVSTWQKVYWDISHVPLSERDGVRFLKVGTTTANNTILFDDFVATSFLHTPSGSLIASKPNEYLQYRVILASSNPGYKPTLYNIQAEWSNGYKIEQTDSNTVRLYNYTGATQQLRLDAVVFGADLAEWYTVDDQSLEAADVVALTGQTDIFGVPILRRPTGPDDKGLIGAISTQAGKELGLEAANRRLLGLAGRIPVKIDPSSKIISAGDYLTASAEKPGFAIKAEPGDITIAKAFESWTPSSDKKAVLSYIIQPQNAPLVNVAPLSSYVLEKTGTGIYTVKNIANNSIVKPGLSLAEAIIGNLRAGKVTSDELAVGLISPLASGQPITIVGPVKITNNQVSPSSGPLLEVDGEFMAATISARTAKLDDIQADTITAKNIVADTISANYIEGLDAKIASLSSQLSDSEVTTITDRIKARLADLTGSNPTAQDIHQEAAPSLTANNSSISNLESNISTNSAVLASADIDFATINNYLAVIGQATITDLDITGHLYASNLNSKTGTLALANNTLVINDSGEVGINGNLTVSGKVLADSAEFNTLAIGAKNASSSAQTALGALLSVYNEDGVAVATIDASGSASLSKLTTNMITIASAGTATSSSLLSSLVSTNATAGESKLVTPDTELTIESPYVTSNSLVYLTPTGNTDNKVLFVKSKHSCDTNIESLSEMNEPCIPSFTVGIDTPASSDISFNWWIIQLGQPKSGN